MKPRESQTLWETLPIREGHYLLESGLHAEAWIDLDTLFLDPKTLAPHIAALAALISEFRITAVCGPLLGGAFVAQAIAMHLGARFYYAQKETLHQRAGLFQAEYRLPASQRVPAAVERFAVVDDVIGAGSAVRAAVSDLASLGAATAVVGALFTLGSKAKNYLAQSGIPIVSLGSKQIALWEPERCPHCQAGISLETS